MKSVLFQHVKPFCSPPCDYENKRIHFSSRNAADAEIISQKLLTDKNQSIPFLCACACADVGEY